MFIDANRIQDIIEQCESTDYMSKPLITVREVAQELRALLDEEEARLEEMARDYEEMELGRIEMEEAAIEKQLSLCDWPGAV
ncbi:hypothetical protein CMI47_18140 [Candidatus Pacearchaeota archaeon]|nr:hypothetical protein [Candidatus Pacearchaeota archaeon]|tara:strand:- start:760 stop:1005 length:246 start_codon:yes stop_codon:yes gene_type:complete